MASSLKNYWRVLRMHTLDKADRDFNQCEKRDVYNYLSLLIDEYGLRTVPKKKPVIGLDDLYLLYTHWVLDDRTYDDEHQRVQIATGLLAAVFFGCRPCSLFDTRVKLDEELGEPADGLSDLKDEMDNVNMDASKDIQRRRLCDPVMVVDPDCQVDDNHSSTAYEGDSNSGSSTACENDSDSDSDSTLVYDPDDDCDSDNCDTDDDCGAGPEKTRAFLYRHFTIIIVPNLTLGKPNMVFMKFTLLHTKGEDNNPRVKTLVIDGEDEDPLFSLLDHFISLTMADDASEANSAKDVQNMFWVKMPPGKKSLTLKWKRRVLDLPVFREPLRGVGECGTSPTEPLRASTWIRYLKKLGLKAGFQHSFTQYGLRRGLLNVVNKKAPASVRDQLFDHKPGTVTWYLDQEVQCDTKACYLGRPSHDVVHKMARLASLTADTSAPTQVSSEQKAELSQHPQGNSCCRGMSRTDYIWDGPPTSSTCLTWSPLLPREHSQGTRASISGRLDSLEKRISGHVPSPGEIVQPCDDPLEDTDCYNILAGLETTIQTTLILLIHASINTSYTGWLNDRSLHYRLRLLDAHDPHYNLNA